MADTVQARWHRPVRPTTVEVNAAHRRRVVTRHILYSKPPSYEIPPATRLIVDGCRRHCRTCTNWTRNDGGCPGTPAGSECRQPICHSDVRPACDQIIDRSFAAEPPTAGKTQHQQAAIHPGRGDVRPYGRARQGQIDPPPSVAPATVSAHQRPDIHGRRSHVGDTEVQIASAHVE